ncbi:NAD-dependent epimerase/dehydratase family protein [Alteromonas sp. RKMC-009]|uniref:NAD-dependent epimerase/dehydratase family protein n=1 Tax=Alteromonas sp. RKMC-009 TaxID=2267264 RepID=UPI000E67B120|nr:GDP-mannose 4,6-dehydratase [Alteromonas sp. RKMC-009]AYA63676.1 NAD-dependent epimerase/dehydratase family protein [Alteromonas sp. RKMC-009]
MSKAVFVIGANSFSGASFCRYLLAKGSEVVGISRSEQPVMALAPQTWGDTKGYQFHQLDLNHDLPRIMQLIDDRKPAHIYNFAAQSMVGQSWEFPEHWFMTNVVSTVKLHNFLRHKDFLDKYIHISTPEVYGSCSGFIDESHGFNPSTPYAVSRAAADMSLKTFFDVHQFPVVTTRAANVYGEGQPLYRIIPKTIMSVMKGETLPLHGGGHSERSFIHIDDVSDATLGIGERGTIGDTYHISTNDTVSIRNLVATICERLGTTLEQVCQITEDRPGKDAAYLLNTDKLRRELGWQDTISLEDGISRTIDWAKQYFDVLKTLPTEYQHKA